MRHHRAGKQAAYSRLNSQRSRFSFRLRFALEAQGVNWPIDFRGEQNEGESRANTGAKRAW
jgi:hypothetical protein